MKIIELLKLPGFVNNFFTKGNKRSIEAKKNIVGSLFIRLISIIISLLIVPLSLNYVNSSQYGIWLTLSSMVAWISFFDIGFTQGLRNKFAAAKAKGDKQYARMLVSTTYVYMGVIFLILWTVLLFVNRFVTWHKILNISSDMEIEITRLAAIIITYFCFQFVFRIINTVLIADQKPAVSSLLNMLGQLFSLLIVFTLTKLTNGSLLNLGLAIGIGPTLVLIIANVTLFNTRYSNYRPSIRLARKESAKDIMSLGIKFFILQIASIVQYQTISFLIAHYFDTEQVTAYNIAYKYFFTLQMIFTIILSPLWSSTTDAYNSGDILWIKNIVRKYLLILIPFIIMGSIMLIYAKSVYDLWLGKDVVNVKFSISLLCYIFISTGMFASIFVFVINGIGAIKIQYISSITTSFGFIILSILLIKKFHFGVEAILISSIISNIYGYFIAPLQYYKILIIKSKSSIWYK